MTQLFQFVQNTSFLWLRSIACIIINYYERNSSKNWPIQQDYIHGIMVKDICQITNQSSYFSMVSQKLDFVNYQTKPVDEDKIFPRLIPQSVDR